MFITLEGGEGVGKTTQAKMLSEWMKNRNMPFCLTKEPGDPNLVECVKMRELLLDPKNDLTSSAELLLFLADRSQHVERLIKPELEKGKFVICDRYTDSTLAYQIAARGFSRNKLEPLLDFASDGLKPDITFIIDVPVDIALERARSKSIYENGDRMEQENILFHERVRQGFLKISNSLSEQSRIVLINAAPPKTIDQIHNEITVYLSKQIWEKD